MDHATAMQLPRNDRVLPTTLLATRVDDARIRYPLAFRRAEGRQME